LLSESQFFKPFMPLLSAKLDLFFALNHNTHNFVVSVMFFMKEENKTFFPLFTARHDCDVHVLFVFIFDVVSVHNGTRRDKR
jgi:hypothetical protein